MAVELIIATFENDENKAEELLKRIKELEKQKALKVVDIAAITRPKEGEVRVMDIGDVTPKRGAVFGAITGGLLGLMVGPVGAVVGAVAGAATGRTSAKLIDYGVSNRLIKDIENSLKPGSSAVIAYVEMKWIDRAIVRLQELGAEVIHDTLESELVDPLLESKKRS
ncbi:MAG TPA: DUF1269 domain-containing protein [Anaerolineae bacterium]|nr:DUF1269 domain-containing protein [Anaerolineae bacterium]